MTIYYSLIFSQFILEHFFAKEKAFECENPENLGEKKYIMGKLLSKLFGKREIRILMLGLDAAGKTSEFLGIFILNSLYKILVII
jgi:hypothetical protein